MKNPNTPLRSAYVSALKTATGLGVWGKRVPLTVKPIPKKYITIINQTKQENVPSKCGYEWKCQITIDIHLVNALGFSDTATLDAIEEQVLNVVKNIQVAGFIVKRTTFIGQSSLDADTSTQSIERTVLIYEHWLNRAE